MPKLEGLPLRCIKVCCKNLQESMEIMKGTLVILLVWKAGVSAWTETQTIWDSGTPLNKNAISCSRTADYRDTGFSAKPPFPALLKEEVNGKRSLSSTHPKSTASTKDPTRRETSLVRPPNRRSSGGPEAPTNTSRAPTANGLGFAAGLGTVFLPKTNEDEVVRKPQPLKTFPRQQSLDTSKSVNILGGMELTLLDKTKLTSNPKLLRNLCLLHWSERIHLAKAAPAHSATTGMPRWELQSGERTHCKVDDQEGASTYSLNYAALEPSYIVQDMSY